MELMRKTSLAIGLSTLLSACGGSNPEVAADWESYVVPQGDTAPFTVTHRDLAMDAYGDLVTVGNAGFDSDPSTPAMDVEHKIVLAKQDRSGNQIWQTLLDYPTDRYTAYEVESDNNGNLYVVGDGFIMATDSYGDLLWQDQFEGLGLSVTVENDLVYVPARTTRVYDLNGNLQLSIDNGGIYPWEVKVTDDGSIIQATWDAITRHDSLGNLVWSAPAPADVTTMSMIQVDSAENVYATYLSNDGSSSGNTAAAHVVKIDSTGNQQWSRFIPDRRSSSNYYKSGKVHAFLTSDGNLLNVTAGTKGRQLTKLNSDNGQVIWEKVYSGEGVAEDAYLTSSDKLILVGSSNPQQFDANGELTATGAMAPTITKNSLAVYGNTFFVGGSVHEDASGADTRALYTAAFSE